MTELQYAPATFAFNPWKIFLLTSVLPIPQARHSMVNARRRNRAQVAETQALPPPIVEVTQAEKEPPSFNLTLLLFLCKPRTLTPVLFVPDAALIALTVLLVSTLLAMHLSQLPPLG